MAPRRGRSGAVGPGRQVRALLGRQLVDLYAHRRELEAGDLAVDLAWHAVHLLCQAPTVFDHVLDGQGVVREAHVHDGRGMPVGGGQVDEASLAEAVEPPSASNRELLDEGRQGAAVGGEAGEGTATAA